MLLRKKSLIFAITLSSFFTFTACSEEKEETQASKVIEGSSSIEESIKNDTNELKKDVFFKKIVTGEQDPEIKLELVYDVAWNNSEWADVDFSIDKVKIVEVDKFQLNQDQSYRGLIAVHYKLENNGKQDLSVYPEKAHLILKDGKNLEATLFLDYWDNIFSANRIKEGLIYFSLDNPEGLLEAKEFYLQFKLNSKSATSSASHIYQVQFPLILE